MLEAQCHENSQFITLTYEEPPSNGSLVKSHLSSTIDRLRKSARRANQTVRFFGVGEYGDQTQRPHYHAAIFGLAPTHQGLLEQSWQGISGDLSGAVPGFIHVGVLNSASAEYIAGYATKKLTKPDDVRLAGRSPEFAVMSRNPGIGVPYILPLIEALNTSHGALYLARFGDVPTAFSIAGKTLPLGPFIRSKLRLFFFGESTQPRSAADIRGAKAHVEKLQHLPPLPMDASTPQIIEAFTQASNAHRAATTVKKTQLRKKVKFRHDLNQQRKKL